MIFDTQNPQAVYVIAAYALAAVALLGLLLVSVRAWRRQRSEWEQVQKKSAKPAP